MKRIYFKIFLMFNLLIMLLLGFIALSNTLLLEKYYFNYKKNQIEQVANRINKNPNIAFEEEMRKNNIKIFYLNSHMYEMSMRRLVFTPRGAIKKGKEERRLIPTFEELSNEGQIRVIRGFAKGEKFILYSQKVGNKALVIHSPVVAINEAVIVSSRFLAIIFVFGIIISSLVSLSLSKKISNPIKEIDRVAKNMIELNFDDEIIVNRQDELGTLSKSINTLSKRLKGTIDNLKISNERLKVEIEKEKEIDKLRKEFISNVNHELKTPIAIIEGYAEGLMDNIANEEDKNFYCEVIVDECKKMDQLVKKLLIASKYDNEFIELNYSKFSLKERVEGLLKKYRLDIETKGLKLDINMEDIEVEGDYEEIGTAIDNYLSNSINYTKKADEINIKVYEENQKICFSIKNPSEEIGQDKIEKLFEAFNKLDKARTRKYGGTGLGLSIVKKIIELHRGEYGAKYDSGSIEFYFTLNNFK